MIPINYKVVESSKTVLSENETFKKTITRDLSGGGVCIKLEENLILGMLLNVNYFLDDFNKVHF